MSALRHYRPLNEAQVFAANKAEASAARREATLPMPSDWLAERIAETAPDHLNAKDVRRLAVSNPAHYRYLYNEYRAAKDHDLHLDTRAGHELQNPAIPGWLSNRVIGWTVALTVSVIIWAAVLTPVARALFGGIGR